MAKSDQDDNKTGTELDILKSLEKSFFDKHPDAQRRNTQRSLKWFSSYVPKSRNKVRTSQMFRDRSLWTTKVKPGRMYFFEYDAIHKDSLPVWDRYPLIFPYRTYRGENGKMYMMGINLHYLPPRLRFTVMKLLLTIKSEKRFRKATRVEMKEWSALTTLGNSKLFEHCVKKYRLDAVKSRFVEIPSTSWELAVFLPLARWQGDSQSVAWNMRK